MAVLSNNQHDLIGLFTRDRVQVRRTGKPSPFRNPVLATAALLTLLGVLALLYVAQAGSLVTTNKSIIYLKEEQARVQASNEQLRYEIAVLESTERLQREAALRGMVKPKQFMYVPVEPVTKKKAVEAAPEEVIPGSPFLDLWRSAVEWFHRATTP